ncbi:hypothetical protein [Psychrobacter sp. UBA3962]|nr:hypothetical protein [Psychrobacter sp. UBA3962]
MITIGNHSNRQVTTSNPCSITPFASTLNVTEVSQITNQWLTFSD